MQPKRPFSVRNLFPLVALGYVLIQVFAAWRVYTGLGLKLYAIPVLVAWIALMTLSLRILRRLERAGRHRQATVVAWVGFLWMGSVFTFFWISLGLDVLGLAVT